MLKIDDLLMKLSERFLAAINLLCKSPQMGQKPAISIPQVSKDQEGYSGFIILTASLQPIDTGYCR